MLSATFDMSLGRFNARMFHLAVIAGLACALVIGKALPPAELIAVLVADEGAQLTTFID